MLKNKKGVTLVSLVLTIIILIILAGVSIVAIIGDNGIIPKAIQMDLETAKGEIKDNILLLLNEEILGASVKISGTANDIGTEYNEPSLIYFFTGHQNFPDTPYADIGAKNCLEALDSSDVDVMYRKEEEPYSTITVKSKYKLVIDEICNKSDKYGTGETISEGNIFTLEAVKEKDNNGKIEYLDYDSPEGEYKGKFQLKYYDRDGNVSVLETIALYMTNQS